MRTFTAFLLVAVIALGQQTQAPAGDVTTFKTTRQLVVEIVTVKDKAGNPILGLTTKDFIVTENGKPQTVSYVEFEKVDDTPDTTVVERPEIPVNVDPMTRHQIAPEPTGTMKYRDRRLMALYFDMTAMPPQDQARALSAARKFIHEKMAGPDVMAVMQFEGAAVKVVQDFTSDKDSLDAALLKLIVGDAVGADGTFGDDSDADTGTAFGQDDGEFNIFTTDRQLAALETAVKMLGTLNEKKALIYFASGLRLNGIDNQAQMRGTTNAAIRANVSIYTVDARGLEASAPLGDATKGNAGGAGMYSGTSQLANASNFQKSQDTMYALASDTGGKALLDNNDLGMGIVQAQKAMSSYYIVSYYTTDESLDGKFRRIKITLKDESAKLDYRVGYYAGKVFAKFTVADKERQLEDAFMLGDPMTELTMNMEVNYFQLNRAEYFVPVAVKIPGSELALARRGGAEHTVITFMTEIKDEFGMTVQNVRDIVDIKLSDQTAQQLAKRPIQYDTGFTLLPGTYTIKTLARDDETGHIGTYINKFLIPNLNKEEKHIPISSVVLSGQRMDMKDALFNAKDKTKQALEANPLYQDGQKLIPSVTKVFSASRDMYVYLQAYERGATTTQPLVAFVSFYRRQVKAFETPPLSVTEGLDLKSKAVPLRFAFSLSKLPPGKYDCQVSVIDPTGQKVAFWQAPVVLVP